jgi:GNAT superfamily N-acetyltransferase
VQVDYVEVHMLALWQRTNPDAVAPTDLAEGKIRSWECRIGSRTTGHCAINARTGQILGLMVQQGYEGRGIGTTLLSLAVACLRGEGANRIWLEAPSSPDAPSRAFYRSRGWIPTGRMVGTALEEFELPDERARDPA